MSLEDSLKEYSLKDDSSKMKSVNSLRESLERALMGSTDISYSAFLDDCHTKYTESARQLRTKRRSLTLKNKSTRTGPGGNDNDNNDNDNENDFLTDNPTDSFSSNPSPSDYPSPPDHRSPTTKYRMNEFVRSDDIDKLDSLDISNSSDSSEIMIVSTDVEGSLSKKLDAHSSEIPKFQDSITNKNIQRILGNKVLTTTISNGSNSSGLISSEKLSQYRGIDYGSDITSADRGLLDEFGDSEVKNGPLNLKSSRSSQPTHHTQSKQDIRQNTLSTSSQSAKSITSTTSVESLPIEMDLDALLAKEIANYSTILESEFEASRSSNTSDTDLDPETNLISALESEITSSMKSTTSGRRADSKSMNDNSMIRDVRGARRMMKWVNDDMVDTCYGCSDRFTYLNGKHHCRLCGRIFCQKCSRYKTVLPIDILSKIPDRPGSFTDILFSEDPNSSVRVCGDCFKYASNIIRIRKIIKVFELCGFNLIELEILSTFSDDWKRAAEFCIDRFREIQYKLSIEDLTAIDKKYIWVNRHLLSRHSRWMVLLFKSCDMSDPKKVNELRHIMESPKKLSCWDMKCSRFCSEEIQLGDMLDLVKYNNNDHVISEYIIDCVVKIDGVILMDYLPFLVSNAVNNIFMIEILLRKARTDFVLMTNLYWCIKAFIPDKVVRRNSIIQALRFIKENCDDVFSSRFKIMIKNEKLSMDWIRLQNSQSKRKIVVPVCPEQDFDSIDIDNIKIMDSNSKPVIIPFRTTKTLEKQNIPKPVSKPTFMKSAANFANRMLSRTPSDSDLSNKVEERTKLIMYKEDDIRKDYVILGIINIINNLLNTEANIDIATVKYRVMPTSENTGYIEIVENARTIYDIIQGQTIQNYILNHNESAVVADIKDRFIKSTALYCVISYLFGFGDRHLENIMISETGLLFHIDFGYILGQDPKYTNNKSLRVTPEIINVIGGQNTENYYRFSEYCTVIYTCLRRHVNLFSNLLSVIPLIDPSITNERIMHEIFDRFEVGENNLEAATHMDLKVRRDSGSFDYMIIDFLHRSKNTQFIKGLKYVKDAVFGKYSGGS